MAKSPDLKIGVFAEKQTNVFAEINEFAKDDGFDIEHAVLVDRIEKVVTAGINISYEDGDAPLFLSVDELRRMADEAEKLTIEMMNR